MGWYCNVWCNAVVRWAAGIFDLSAIQTTPIHVSGTLASGWSDEHRKGHRQCGDGTYLACVLQLPFGIAYFDLRVSRLRSRSLFSLKMTFF